MSPVIIPISISGNLNFKELYLSLDNDLIGQVYITVPRFLLMVCSIAYSAGKVLPLPVCAVIVTFLLFSQESILHF